MSAQVDFQTFDIDGQVHDLMWCGAQDEVVLLHTAEGTIYRSRDRGLSWKRLRALLSQTGLGVADEDQEVRRRAACRQSGRPTQLITTLDSSVADWLRPQDDSEPNRRLACRLYW